jgi:hypothetical protein
MNEDGARKNRGFYTGDSSTCHWLDFADLFGKTQRILVCSRGVFNY